MRLINFVMRLIPARVGGSRWNVWNAVFGWLEITPEFRPPFAKWVLKYPRDWHYEVTGRSRAPLWNWIEEHKPDKILEVGLGSGENARKIIELSEGCTYFCFDDLSMNNFEAYDELRRKANTKFYIGDTMDTLPRFADSLPKMDLIFIDGAHDYIHVKNDWEACKKLMHSSTACFFHDYELLSVSRVVNSIDEGFKINIITPPRFKINIITPPCPPIFALVRRKKVR